MSRAEYRAWTRWSKKALQGLCLQHGITISVRDTREDLLDKLGDRFLPASTVYGLEEFSVEKDTDRGHWTIRSPQGNPVVHVPFRLLFTNKEEAAGDNHLLAALEASVAMEPLTAEELQAFLASRPDLHGRSPFMLDPVETPWEAVTVDPPAPTQAPALEPEPEEEEPLSLKRKITI